MRLLDYSTITKVLEDGTSHLLLGNGFSISYSPVFSYSSLYNVAVEKGLSGNAQKLFEKLGTNNFEGVLRLLENLSWATQLYYDIEDKGERIKNDIEVIKETLITSIAESHLHDSGEVLDVCKECALRFLQPYKTVFTTNYDLLLYWVSMSAPDKPAFGDCFRSEFENPGADYVVFSEHLGGGRGILFLHGALHLYFGDGEIKKHCWLRTRRPLMDLIREGLDNRRYPLFVAEGLPEKKLEQINSNAYLAYCLGKLGRIQNRLVVYGNTLGSSDKHVSDVIAENLDLKELYVGIYGGSSTSVSRETMFACEEMQARRTAINQKLKKPKPLNIHYFDSSTADIWGAQR